MLPAREQRQMEGELCMRGICKKMKKKYLMYLIIAIAVIVVIIAYFILVYKPAVKCSEPYVVTCYDSESNNMTKESIPCINNESCSQANMYNFCKPGYANVLECFNTIHYCEDGVCKGCNCE